MEPQELGVIVDRLKHDLEKMEQQNAAAHKEMYARLGKLEQQAPVTDHQFTQIMTAIQEIKSDLKSFKTEIETRISAIEKAPAKKWDHLQQTIMACLVSGIVGFIISKLFGG